MISQLKYSLLSLVSFQAIGWTMCLLSGIVSTMLHAQTIPPCYTQVFHQQYLQELPKKTDSLKNKINNNIQLRNSNRIPVVVHIVYKEDEENIGDEQIYAQLDRLNQGFNTLYKEELPEIFRPVAAVANIVFCLAKFDDNGAPTTGITRMQTNISSIGNPRTQAIKYMQLGGTDAWNPDKYLNIWVGNTGPNLLGYSTFPDAAGTDIDGIVLHPDYFGILPSTLLDPPYTMGKTLIHETGHYLGLCHLSGCSSPSCKDDDLISDTPAQSVSYTGENCPVHPQISCLSEDMFMNYMSLAPDPCIWTFTKEQVSKMHMVLSNERASLVTESKCNQSVFDNLNTNLQLTTYSEDGSLIIQIEAPISTDAYLYVYTVSGQLVYTKNLKNRYLINVGNPLPQGIYILYFYTENQHFYKKVLITQ